jgi:signal transduction histidine kinase
VKDEGIRIAAEDVENLFDSYYRVESKATRSISDFGLGLCLCKEIIDRHDGAITAKSEPAKGSTFEFSFDHRKIVSPVSSDKVKWLRENSSKPMFSFP